MMDETTASALRMLAAGRIGTHGDLTSASSARPVRALVGLVLTAAGIKPPLQQGEGSDDTPLHYLEAAGVRPSPLEPEAGWWRRSSEPMLAFRRDTGRPVALLPRGQGGYDAADGHKTVPVDADIAGGLTGFLAVAPSFPPGPVDTPTLIRFSSHGLGPLVWPMILVAAMGGALSMVMPILAGLLVDPIIAEAQVNQLLLVVGALIAGALCTAAFDFGQSLFLLRFGGWVDFRLQHALWDRLIRLPLSKLRGMSTGDLLMRITSADMVRTQITGMAQTVLTDATVAVSSVILMLSLDLWLGTVAGLALLVFAAIYVLLARRQYLREWSIMSTRGEVQQRTLDLCRAVKDIRVAAAEERAFRHWMEKWIPLRFSSAAQQRDQAIAVALSTGLASAVLGIVLITLAWKSGMFVADASVSIPVTQSVFQPRAIDIMPVATFVSFNAALGQLIGSVLGLTRIAHLWLTLPVTQKRLAPILQTPEERSDGERMTGPLRGDIEISNLSFRYESAGQPVLKDVNLGARAGDFVALVGPTGAGKSTIIRLLLGLETPTSGSIVIDGKPMSQLQIGSLRRRLGVVLQEPHLLAGTILENIGFGSEIDRNQAWDALRFAGMDKDVRAMPMGLDTYIAHGGLSLSGGQRQKLAIARLAARKPGLVLLDEATSSLDNAAQADVAASLAKLDCTRIVVAHRLSTIRQATCIHVLDQGRIVESGTYAELIERGGLFAELVRHQIEEKAA